MTKAARVSSSVSVSAATQKKEAAARSDRDELLTILLFCGGGLVVSLGLLLAGAPYVWN
ncbi:hypothetical protein ACQR1I_17175 [Bradyrhizobium sp. HKCCYLS2038]|uniref:hypothetical protein n=1 Tax=unclassified Bradyrhizobium TaxID=2631580 RepID=UPI003EB94D01